MKKASKSGTSSMYERMRETTVADFQRRLYFLLFRKHLLTFLMGWLFLWGATVLVLRVVGTGDGMPQQSMDDVLPDLSLPPVVNGSPEAGKRVRMTTAGWEKTSVYHALYLPVDWSPDASWPVIIEYPGNGGFQHGVDVSHGTVEGCCLGYGLTAGHGAIWVSLPFIDSQDAFKQNSVTWWGDVEETKRYCIAALRETCDRFGGDPQRIVIAGFSRGAIAALYIGLHDDQIASLWSGFFCHSHFDGVRENWPYPGADRAAALARLKRLGNRPVWISHEESDETIRYLKTTGISVRSTFVALPYPDHTAQWILRDLPIRDKARGWWQDMIRIKPD